MTWTRLPDTFNDDPALLRVSRSARLLHVEALVYCNKHTDHELDGLLPAGALRRITDAEDPEALVVELVAAGLWEVVELGWQLDWSDQETAAAVNERKKYRAETQRRYRDRKERHGRGDHSMCDPRYCSSVTGNASGNTNGYETPSRPVPSRPLSGDREQAAAEPGAGAPDCGCSDGWLGEDDHGRPIPCPTCKPHLIGSRDV